MSNRKSFYIIDGHAQIYRAYFAPFRDLTSPTGEPTKATFVFTQMLLNLVAQRKPDYLAMVIDTGPLLGSIEAPLVCSAADRVVLTISRGQQRPLVERSVSHLAAIGARLADRLPRASTARTA